MISLFCIYLGDVEGQYCLVYFTLLHCFIVTLLHCYIVTLLHCYIVTLLHCYIVRLLHI